MINDSTKRELWKSGEGRCARCGRPLVYEETVIDHIFPKSLGGADHIDNLRLLCKQCNSKLSNRAYFSEYAFKEYLKQFLDQDVRFENVCMDTPAETSDGQKILFATVYKGNIIKNLIMDCQSYTKYRPNETTGGIFVSWRRKEELPTGA